MTSTLPMHGADAGDAAILRARARALAARPQEDTQDLARRDSLEVLEFRLAGERYALETSCVRGIHPLVGMVPLPCAPACVMGVVNLRGQVVPVLGFRRFLELPDDTGPAPVNVVLVHDGDTEAALPVEGAAEVRLIARSSLQAGLPGFSEAVGRCVRGITVDGITLLDVGGLLGHPSLQPEPGRNTNG